MTAYDPTEAARLVAEVREDDTRMTRALWEAKSSWNNSGMPLADFTIPGHNGGATVEMLADDAFGIVRLRNNARPIADQLEAAMAEIALMRPVVEASITARKADSAEVGQDCVTIAEIEPLAAASVKRTQAALTRWRSAVDAYLASKP